MIIQPGKSRNILDKKIEKEINNINHYENKWKIKTNTTKFTILRIALRKITAITVAGEQIPYAEKANILGLKLGRHGYTTHIKGISQKVTTALNTTNRFAKLDIRIKLHLVKAFVPPILTYQPTL